MTTKELDQRTKGDVQHAFAGFKKEITTHIREYTKSEVPKMEARIAKAKEDLKMILNNEVEMNLAKTQLSANDQEDLIARLERDRYSQTQDNIAIKHKLEGECLTKYLINQNKERIPRDTIMRLQSNSGAQSDPKYTTRYMQLRNGGAGQRISQQPSDGRPRRPTD